MPKHERDGLSNHVVFLQSLEVELREALAEVGEDLADRAQRQLHAQLGKIEAMMERLERRLWLTVYGVVAVVLTQGTLSLLDLAS